MVVVLSLFDGISCAKVAVERLGIPVGKYYASEIDKYAIQVSSKNHPDAIQLGDINNHEQRELEPIDLLIGGSPCQDLSIAKKDRKGLSGDRSGLFYKYVEVLRTRKPRYFILENVASMSKEARDTISEELGVQPIMINAALVGAQNRKRYFWTNIEGVTLPEDRGVYLKDVLEENVSEIYNVPVNVDGSKKVKSNTIRASGRSSGYGDRHNWDTIRVATLNK